MAYNPYAGGYQQPGYHPGYGPAYPTAPPVAPPPPYYPPPPPAPAAAPVVVNVVNNQNQNQKVQPRAPAPAVVIAAPQPRPAPARIGKVGVVTVGIAAVDRDSPVSIVKWMNEAASKAANQLNSGDLSSSELTVIMTEIQNNVETLTIKLSVSHKALVANDEFRGSFMTAIRSTQRLIELARGTIWCCCFKYMGDKKLQRVCELVWEKLSTFNFDNFKLDLSTSGQVAITGNTGVSYKQSTQTVNEVDTVQTVLPAPLVQPTEHTPLVQPQPGYNPGYGY